MRYELDLFDYIVSEYFKNEKQQLSKLEFHEWKQNLLKEEERLRQSLMKMIFVNQEDKAIERQIQFYQHKLILISKEVVNKIEYLPIPYERIIKKDDYRSQLGHVFLKILSDLLTFIENHFTKYFNQDSVVPTTYFERSSTQLRYKLFKIKELGELKRIDPPLLKIIIHNIQKAIENPKGISYRKFIYCKTFLSEMLVMFSRTTQGIKMEKQIITNLLYLNFNVFAIYNYISNRITDHYQAKSNYNEQLLQLQLFKKLINQSHIKPDFEFHSNTPSLKESLSVWIEEEIFYFKERKQLSIQYPQPEAAWNKAHKNKKLYTTLSVSQLAYFMRLLYNANVISLESKSKLIELISDHFSTTSQRNISAKSLKNKIYSPEITTIENIQELMESLIERAEKDKVSN
ncbi:hypothetical protein QYS48_34130 [Marivirga arenosa]|uniref:Uncharacterized protein n=1 Tax=Marivirga arenosa TaxID=3059076 RepID=A0AA51R8R3_9BACT|nr:hypothetical protein [Marivirga sp. ABR2-2]WMN06891.1 hypothetical protein QYS48_34130 [Marivirga sp. ABR2-2]